MKQERSEPVSENDSNEELRRTRRELDKVKARLDRLQRRKSSLLAMAAHDLRTPLAVIQGYSQLLDLALAAEADPTIREYVTTIVAHTEALRHGIENLVALDQLERGEVQMAPTRCDLNELVRQALAQVEGLLTIKSIEAETEIPAEPLWVMADEQHLGRILYSLMAHAEKYARERGRLFITVGRKGDMAQVTTRDPNRLLPAEMVGRVFDLVEVGRDGRASLRGTDLGLVVARHVAEAHGGRVTAESDAVVGTRFTLYLPLAPASEPADD